MIPSDIPNSPGIYCITCKTNKKIYIGSAVDLRRRWIEHQSRLVQGIHPNRHLQRAWNKYGTDAFIFEILEFVLTPELLTAREQWWFSKLHPFGKRGFNILPTAGSQLGAKRTPEVREEMSRSRMGRPGTRNGKKASPETRAKLSASRLGNQIWLGKKHTPTSIAKLRAANLGKKRDPETYRHRMKAIIVVSPSGEEFTVLGIRQFCREHGLDDAAITRVAKGKYKQHKGWKARFPDSDAF